MVVVDPAQMFEIQSNFLSTFCKTNVQISNNFNSLKLVFEVKINIIDLVWT